VQPERSGNLIAGRLLAEIATMLRAQQAAPYRVRAYERAADAVAMYPEPLAALRAEGRLRAIPHVGPALAGLLEEFVETGGMRLHAQLAAETEAALGAGGRPGRLRLKAAWETARVLQAQLAVGGAARVEVAGAARRMVTETLLDGVDLVALPESAGAAQLLETFGALPSVAALGQRDERSARARLRDGVEARLYLATPDTWGGALLWRTGSDRHLRRLAELAAHQRLRLGDAGLRDDQGRSVASRTEAELYARLELPFVAPELREDRGEVEAAQAGALPRLVELADLRGDLHTHTDWTDGTMPLAAMAAAAKARGYSYMALTDHSQALAFINGLAPDRLAEQRRLVDRLNHELAPFVILHGTEMDILEDGRLDYADAVLAQLDYVSASVHRRHRQDRAAMTRRMLRAVAHPLVDTLNHPFGRMLGSREPVDVDMDAVLAAAAENGCAVEVSGDPARMDLDGVWARRAGELGARCTISTDAHSALDFDNAWIGLGSARRGWLTAAQVVNTRPLDELRRTLRHARRG
jgi:DNA polymerase (family X)